MSDLLLVLSQTILISIPLVLAALGGVMSERSGVVNIALEGILLTSAFVSAAVGHGTESVLLGVAAGIASGLVLATVHSGLVLVLRADAIISGLAINLFAAGATEYGAHILWPASDSRALPALAAFRPFGIDLLDVLLGRPFVVLTCVLVSASVLLVSRTVFGLRQQAVGEKPAAAETVGVSVRGVRTASVLLSGGLAALGGAWLAFNVGQFQYGMSAGKGYIAMAAVVFGGWTPLGATRACLLFAFSEALGARIERAGLEFPSELVGTLPYVLTIVALASAAKRARAPGALGVAYERAES